MEDHGGGGKTAAAKDCPAAALVAEIAAVAAGEKKIFVHGVGREGLMMKALCMRLFHLGLRAHVIGDVTTPPAAPGDLLLASAGPGHFATVAAICAAAAAAAARVVLLTAQPAAAAGGSADRVVVVPAKTMVDGDDDGDDDAALPMGSLYEGALFVLFEMVVLRLGPILGQTPNDMRSRHTNLE
ncbi:sugar isomerase (SIS) family protein [Wolffia australiana]